MTGIERITEVFSKKKNLKIMTHVVGGYPDLKTCESIILTMAMNQVDLIEIQLPFSDPLADGPAIVHANHAALQAGVTTTSVLTMIEHIRKKISTPFLIMSYVNPCFSFGIERIIRRAQDIGIDGFIVPDCPMEEQELMFPQLCHHYGRAFVPILTPFTTKERMQKICTEYISPFVYAVLRLGVTGKKTILDRATTQYLDSLRETTGRYVAAGFGIKEKKQLQSLSLHADCGIIGTAILQEVTTAIEKNNNPIKIVNRFLDTLFS